MRERERERSSGDVNRCVVTIRSIKSSFVSERSMEQGKRMVHGKSNQETNGNRKQNADLEM